MSRTRVKIFGLVDVGHFAVLSPSRHAFEIRLGVNERKILGGLRQPFQVLLAVVYS